MKKDKGLKQRFKNMSFKQRLFVIVGLMILLSGSVIAIYVFSHSATTSYVVSSDEAIIFSDDFVLGEEINATAQAINSTKTINITNNNGILGATFSLNETIVDDDLDSCNNIDDIVVSAEYEGTPLNSSGDTFDIIEGLSQIEILTQIKRLSCPQNVSIEAIITT